MGRTLIVALLCASVFTDQVESIDILSDYPRGSNSRKEFAVQDATSIHRTAISGRVRHREIARSKSLAARKFSRLTLWS